MNLTTLLLAVISLAGEWHVTGDGIDAVAQLPGTTGTQNLGHRWTERDFTVTMDLPQSEALCLEYQHVGPAVWEREFELTEAEASSPLELFLERVMWKSAVSVDGRPCGSVDSLATPHVHRLGKLAPGRHRLRLEIDNSCFYNFSRQSHAYGPNMQAVWNGVLGRLELRPEHWLDSVRVFARAPAEGTLDLEVPEAVELTAASVTLAGFKTLGVWARPSPYAEGRKFVAVRLDGEPEAWSPTHPRLYELTVRADGRERSFRIGFRSLGTSGRALTLNGHKIFTRGNVENTNFARDGLPWMTKAEWVKMLKTLKEEDGVDTIRFHTWCPPEAAFAAADEVGVLLHPEGGIWTDKWMSEGDAIGWGKPVDDFVERELRAIQDAYGNHPSMVSLAIGNELGNSNFEELGEMIREAKAYDPRYLYSASSARWVSSGDDFLLAASIPEHGSKNAMRILSREKLYPRTDWDYENLYGVAPLPVIAHEIGQWPVYPLWDEFFQPFDGSLRPWNYTRHQRKAVKNDTLRFQREYHAASAKLSRLIYKEEVESFLRTPSCAGLQLLEVQDYTGQAEALVGWRDPFYALKPGFRDLPAFSTIWGPISFLARFPRFTWTVGERFAAELQIRNLTDATLPAGTEFDCTFAGRTLKQKLERDTPPGELGGCGRFEVALTASMTGAKQEFRFGTNRWNFWVFPNEAPAPLPAGVVMTDDPKAMKAAVLAGQTVLYTGASRKSGKGQFKSIYWSARWFPVANTTGAALGTWFEVAHPALAGFPTEDFTDWQWYSLAESSTIHRLEGLPKGYRPFALSVNDFHFSDFCATMFEVLVGTGRLFVCGYDLTAATPEAKRLRASVFAYLSGAPAASTPSVGAEWLDVEFAEEKPRDLGGAVYDVTPKWEGQKFVTAITGVPPTTGLVRIDFHQPGEPLTSGRGLLEGRAFEVPFTEAEGATTFVELPVIREDFLDGKLELEIRVMTGPALAVDRIRIIPEK